MPDIAIGATNDQVTGFPIFDIDLTEIPSGASEVARDVRLDAGLTTAVYLSLFTDARAEPAESGDNSDLRGWWGDEFGQFGSLLWQLTRGKATDEVVAMAKATASASLAWMIDVGVAKSVVVDAVRIGLYSISIVVQIAQPEGASSTFRYALNWAAMG